MPPLANPFAQPGAEANAPAGGAWGTAPGGAWGGTGTAETYSPPQPTAPTAPALQPAYAGNDLEAREADLKRREQELAVREARVKTAERELEASGGKVLRSNWPKCYPVCHFDISDCKPENRGMVWWIYCTWIGLCICLGYNTFAATVMLGYQAGESVASWFLSLIYLFLGIPLGFWLWTLRFYRAVRDESTVGQLFFFLWYVLHCGFCTWAVVAYPFSSEYWSFCGFITMTKAWDWGTFAGVVFIIGASFWAAEAAASWLMLLRAWAYFRGIKPAEEKKNPFTATGANAATATHV